MINLGPKGFGLLSVIEARLPDCLFALIGGYFVRRQVGILEPLLLFLMFFFHVLLLLATYFVRVLYLFVVDVIFVVLVKDYLKHMIKVFVFFV